MDVESVGVVLELVLRTYWTNRGDSFVRSDVLVERVPTRLRRY